MINTTIDFTVNATIFLSLVYFGFCLIASMHDCLMSKKLQSDAQVTEATLQVIEDPSIEIDTQDDTELSEVSLLPNFADMTVIELRKVCNVMGIVWRNASGKNKHLKKAEMLSLIMV